VDPVPRTDPADRTRELLTAPRDRWRQILYFLGMHQLLAGDSPDAPDATGFALKMHWRNMILKTQGEIATHSCTSDRTLV